MSRHVEEGTIVDRSYRILDKLGEGGMGAVFRATRRVDGQLVALKLISQRLHIDSANEPPGDQDLHLRLALAREFQTLASLHHPNIVGVQSYGFDENLGAYFTMELLDQPRTLLEAGIDRPEAVRVQLIAQLLRALSYVHRRGIVHRDVKPGNVLVVGDEVKLLDFGIATEATNVSDIAGTIEYLAPEILIGEPPTPSSDLYSVGVILYQLLTGDLPHQRTSLTSILDGLTDEGADRTLAPVALEFLQQLPSSLDDIGEANSNSESAEDQRETDPQHTQQLSAGQAESGASTATENSLERLPGPLGEIVRKLLARSPKDRYLSASSVLHDLAARLPYDLPVETEATRESFLQATTFVGREAELAKLAQALNRLTQHTGAAVLVGGESGIGKSRLISEIRTLALVHGCWVTVGQSVTEGGFLYHEWLPFFRTLCFQADITDAEIALFKNLVPDLERLLGRTIADPPAIRPEAAPARLAAMLVGLLKRQTKSIVLILEDLHWGRSESLALLNQVLLAVSELPLFVIATYRSDERPSLPKELSPIELMPLQRLEQKDVGRLTESMLGRTGREPHLIDYLIRQTEGNVFFLVEVVRALAEQSGELEQIGRGALPETLLTVRIGRIAERRLDNVPQGYRPLLEFSATLGRTLNLSALQRAFPQAPMRDFLLECANAAVLESQGTEWRFAHDKLRETILHRLEPATSKALHLQVASTLEDLYVGKEREPFSAALGYHYRQAGLLDNALDYYLKAGDNAAQLYTYEQARAYYAASEELIKQSPETVSRQRAYVDLIIKQIKCSINFSPPDLNFKRVALAREILASLKGSDNVIDEDRLRAARIDYYCGRLHFYVGQPGQAVTLYRSILPVLHEHKDEELIAVSKIFLGFILGLHGQIEKSISMLESCLEPMERIFGSDSDTMRAYLYLAIYYAVAGRHKAARRLIEHVTPWVAEIRQPVYSAVFEVLTGIAFTLAGDWPEALNATARALDLLKETREPSATYLALDASAYAQSRLGNHEQAMELRGRAIEIRRASGGDISKDWWEAFEAEMHLRAGRIAKALEQAQNIATASRAAGLMVSLCIAKQVWGRALAKSGGEAKEVDAQFQESLQIATSLGLVMIAIWTATEWGTVCAERGDLIGSAVHFRDALQLSTDEISPYALEELLRAIRRANK